MKIVKDGSLPSLLIMQLLEVLVEFIEQCDQFLLVPDP